MSEYGPGAAYRFAKTLAAIDPLQRGFHFWIERGKQTDDPADYLGRRLKSTIERVAWVNDLSSARRGGIDRFAPGLDSALDVVREQRRLKGGTDEADELELGWAPRTERKETA
jgi:L-rhamnose isomerase